MEALFVCLTIIGISIVLAWMSGRGVVSGNLNDLMVGSRSFGAFLLFFISVGEVYGIGTMIGVPGAVYSKGSTYVLWFLGYILLAYPVGYFLNPYIWRVGKISNSVTMADTFRWRFNSRGLEMLVAVVGIFFILPWAQMQFAGLGVITEYLGAHIDYSTGVIASAFIAFFYIAVSGIKASAWVSILKDFLMVISIVIGGVVAAVKMPGGVEGIFKTAAIQFPQRLIVDDASVVFSLSTIIFQALGLCMFPFSFQFIFTGKSEETVRRNQIIMPLYMLMYPFLVTAAFFALITVQGLKKPDEAFMAVIAQNLPGWVVGIIGAGAALTCILVISVVGLAIGGIFSKNILGYFKPNAPQEEVASWARIITGVSLAISVAMTLLWPTLMLGIITVSYFGITQFFPPVIAMFFWKRATKWGVGAGLIVGIIAVFALNMVNFAPFGINKGLIALILNAVVLIGVSLMTAGDPESDKKFEEFSSYDDSAVERE